MKQIEATACPFCGGQRLSIKRVYMYRYVACLSNHCAAQGPRGVTEAEAIELWNTRPEIETPPPAAPERLTTFID